MNLSNIRRTLTATLTWLLLCCGMDARAGEAVVFPAPDGIQASEDWQLEVEGCQVFCYQDYRLNTAFPPTLSQMKVSPQGFAIFDFVGKVTVRATLRAGTGLSLDRLKIRPLARKIEPRVHENVIEFELDQPGDVTIDPDGTGLRVLHLFANRPETDVPAADDPNVVYFGPGVHDIEDLEHGRELCIDTPADSHLQRQEAQKGHSLLPGQAILADHRPSF